MPRRSGERLLPGVQASAGAMEASGSLDMRSDHRNTKGLAADASIVACLATGGLSKAATSDVLGRARRRRQIWRHVVDGR
jgi:hypothetical protein